MILESPAERSGKILTSPSAPGPSPSASSADGRRRHADEATDLDWAFPAETICGMTRPGPKRGAPQRQWLSPDPQDEDARVAVYAHVASRARARGRRAAAAAQMSFAAYVEALLLRDEVDEDGRPVWAARPPGPACGAARDRAHINVSEM